jgi:hypothetical protein
VVLDDGGSVGGVAVPSTDVLVEGFGCELPLLPHAATTTATTSVQAPKRHRHAIRPVPATADLRTLVS